jgi:predicted short-subunit dehydrogenase-like oxidoreductase (DUF2520 family)
MHVVIIGPGRLGRSLAALLPSAGHSATLLGRVGAVPAADLVLLTVPDAAIAAASARVPAGPVVAHCSGATDLAPVRRHAAHGSLHPLMTFPGPELGVPDLRGVPAALDGNAAGLAVLGPLAADLGLAAVRVPGDRALYHAAAVLAGNGATVLIAEACRALVAAGVPAHEAPGMLLPLVQRSVANASPDPVAALTGPAARDDRQVLEAHDRALRQAGLADVADLHRTVAEAARAALRRHRRGE